MGVYNNNKDGTRSTIANTIQVVDAPMEQFVSRGEFSAVTPNDVSADNKLVAENEVTKAVDTMPTASADYVGQIVQYVGTTTVNYTNGYFYKCVSDGAVTPTYSWVEVISGGGGGSSEFIGTMAEWNALTTEQKNQYDIVNILEDGQIFNISIPKGGTTGQILTKKSNSDYDAEWETAEDVLYPYVDTPFVLNEKAYINKSGRKVTTQGAQWKYSNPIAVTRGQNIKFTASGFETNLAMIATCDIEGNDISVKVVSEQNPSGGSFYYKTYEYEVIDNGYIVLSCNTQGGEPSLQIKNGVLNANSLISETTFSTLCHAFKKVVCVGDSYTEGRIYKTTDESYVDDPNYSWVHYMNDLTGNKWINCGVSGATAKVWQTNNKGLPKAQAEGVVQAYVIGLGINDSSSESYGLPVGTESDIGTNNDTYYAQLSKVIVELATISPNAYIFVNTCPFYDANRIAPYNAAIKAIVEHFKGTYKIYCIDLANEYAYLFYAPNFTAMFYKGHPTADGQAAIAKKYEFALSNYMKQHEADFRDIPWAPYGT